MNPRDFFGELYRHMEWADASVWSTVLGSDAARAHERLRVQLHHVHMVQRAFLRVWRGEAVDHEEGAAFDSVALATWARAYYPEARAYIAGLPEDASSAVVDLPWSRYVAGSLGYEPGPTTLTETVMQAYAHTAHHRAQILTELRGLGTTPPNIDYIMWLWQHRPDPRWPDGVRS